MDSLLKEKFSKTFTFRRDISWVFQTAEDLICGSEWHDNTMMEFKEQLNNVKSLLNDMEPSEWRRHTTNMSVAGGVIPHIQRTANPEILTQAWCKFWEIINTFPVVPSLPDNKYRSVHLCEAPGAFITALNHYLQLNYPHLKWDWMASTLNPYYEGHSTSSAILDDRFIYHTLDHWNFGQDNRGDILNHSMVCDLKTAVGDNAIHLVTADGSIDCQDVPAEQEKTVVRLFLAETYTALHLLSTGGCFVLKMFTFFEADSISLLYLLCCMFQKVSVFKPGTSKPGNSEVYIVCLGYVGNHIVQHIIAFIEAHIFQKGKLIFNKQYIPETFLKQVIQCSQDLAQSQMETIQTNLEYFSGMSKADAFELKSLKQKFAEMFVLKYNLSPIKNQSKIIPVFSKDVPTMLFKYSQKSVNLSFSERQTVKQVWKRRLGIIKSLAREMFKVCEPDFTFSDTASIADVIPLLLKGVAITGQKVNVIQSSLFCPEKLLTAWNDLLDNIPKSELNKARLQCQDHQLWEAMSSEVSDILDLPENAKKKLLANSVVHITTQSQANNRIRLPKDLRETSGWDVTSTVAEFCEQDKEFQVMLVKNILISFYHISAGDSMVLRLPTSFTRFTVGILFLLASCFETVQIIEPARHAKLRPHLWCFKSFKAHQYMAVFLELLDQILGFLTSAKGQDKVVLQPVPVDVICIHSFYQFVVNANSSLLLSQVWSLTKLASSSS